MMQGSMIDNSRKGVSSRFMGGKGGITYSICLLVVTLVTVESLNAALTPRLSRYLGT